MRNLNKQACKRYREQILNKNVYFETFIYYRIMFYVTADINSIQKLNK